MDPFGIFVIFVIVWWMIFFVTLPFGVRVPDETEAGHATSAPIRPRLAIKAAVTTVLATGLTALVVAAVEYGVIAFRDLVR
jgi:predicted secreted protein